MIEEVSSNILNLIPKPWSYLIVFFLLLIPVIDPILRTLERLIYYWRSSRKFWVNKLSNENKSIDDALKISNIKRVSLKQGIIYYYSVAIICISSAFFIEFLTKNLVSSLSDYSFFLSFLGLIIPALIILNINLFVSKKFKYSFQSSIFISIFVNKKFKSKELKEYTDKLTSHLLKNFNKLEVERSKLLFSIVAIDFIAIVTFIVTLEQTLIISLNIYELLKEYTLIYLLMNPKNIILLSFIPTLYIIISIMAYHSIQLLRYHFKAQKTLRRQLDNTIRNKYLSPVKISITTNQEERIAGNLINIFDKDVIVLESDGETIFVPWDGIEHIRIVEG